jgi:hypothetical protein
VSEKPLLQRLTDAELRDMQRETIAARRACPDWMKQHREQLANLASAVRRELAHRETAAAEVE